MIPIILAEMSWPEATMLSIGAICVVSLLMQRWPWQRDIYHQCDCCDKEEDDE